MNLIKAFNDFLNYYIIPFVQPLNMIQAAYHNNIEVMQRIYEENPIKINAKYRGSEDSALHIATKKEI